MRQNQEYYTAKVLMANLKEWGDLAQAQAQASQAAAAESVEAFNGIKEPQAAFDALKANAEKGIALAGVAKGMKTAASTMENALESAVLIGLAHTTLVPKDFPRQKWGERFFSRVNSEPY